MSGLERTPLGGVTPGFPPFKDSPPNRDMDATTGSVDGVPVVWFPERIAYSLIHPACPADPTHRAFAEPVAVALLAVAEAVREYRALAEVSGPLAYEAYKKVCATIDALDAAQQEATDG